MASPSSTAKLRGKCFRACPSKPLPTAFTPAPGPRRSFRQLFDRYIPTWREDNYSLRGALGLPPEEVWASHLIAKHELLEVVRQKSGLKFDPAKFTIGFARRATGYKRADLILADLDRLRADRQKCRTISDCLCRQSAPSRCRRKGHYQAHLSGQKSVAQSRSGRVPRRLQHGPRRKNYRRRRSMAQYAAISAGSLRNQWHEGGCKWSAQPQHSGWLVVGRAHRRRHRLGHR